MNWPLTNFSDNFWIVSTRVSVPASWMKFRCISRVGFSMFRAICFEKALFGHENYGPFLQSGRNTLGGGCTSEVDFPIEKCSLSQLWWDTLWNLEVVIDVHRAGSTLWERIHPEYFGLSYFCLYVLRDSCVEFLSTRVQTCPDMMQKIVIIISIGSMKCVQLASQTLILIFLTNSRTFQVGDLSPRLFLL